MSNPASALRFELVTLGGAEIAARYLPRDSATYRTLFETGVPRDFLRGIITADPVVSVFQAGGIGPLLQFARSGRDYFALDPTDRRVVTIMDPNRPDFRKAQFVNSSLPQFVETIRVLTERFPYEFWNEESQSKWYADEELERLIESVDPLANAAKVDGVEPFWSAFVPDVAARANAAKRSSWASRGSAPTPQAASPAYAKSTNLREWP